MTLEAMSGTSQGLADRQVDGAEASTAFEHATVLENMTEPLNDEEFVGPPDESDERGQPVQCGQLVDQKSYVSSLTEQLGQLIENFRVGKISESDVKEVLSKLGSQAAETQAYEEGCHDPAYNMFKECMDAGGKFELRNDKIGREWNKALSTDKKLRKEYSKLGHGYKAKAEMRAKWVERKCLELSFGKTHSRSWAKVDTTQGEYLPFGALVESFGIHYDRKTAVEAATRHAEKCIKMAGDWISYDSMGEVVEYLKLRKGFSETMSEAWSLWEKQCGSSIDAGDNADSAGGNGGGMSSISTRLSKSSASSSVAGSNQTETPIPGRGKRTGAETPTPGMGKRNGAEDDCAKVVKKVKRNTALDNALAEATKVKKMHSEATSKAENLVTLIDSNPSWSWARTEEGIGVLRRLMAQVKEKKSDAVSRFVLEEIRDLRRDVGPETLLHMATEFNEVRPALEAVIAKQKALMDAHKSMSTGR